MPRYPKRSMFHPLGVMASTPHSYCVLVTIAGLGAFGNWRYSMSSYYERQRPSPQQELKQRAIMYYKEIERMHRREALHYNMFWAQQDDFGPQTLITQMNRITRGGDTSHDVALLEVTKKDMDRAERIRDEIRAIKARMAAGKE